MNSKTHMRYARGGIRGDEIWAIAQNCQNAV
jgi:hypothetical protein